MVGDLFMKVAEGIRVIPIRDKKRFGINVVVRTGRTVDHDGAASTVGIWKMD